MTTTAPTAPWLQTFSGKAFRPLDPRPEDIDPIDIAHGLAYQCRYAGQGNRFFSIAEHSLLVSAHVPYTHALWGLLHDASEAYLTDIPRPLKLALPDYRAIEEGVMRVIAQRFNLPWPMPPEVKDIDNRLLNLERVALFSAPPKGLSWHIPTEPIPNAEVRCFLPAQAFQYFIARFNELTDTSPEYVDWLTAFGSPPR